MPVLSTAMLLLIDATYVALTGAVAARKIVAVCGVDLHQTTRAEFVVAITLLVLAVTVYLSVEIDWIDVGSVWATIRAFLYCGNVPFRVFRLRLSEGVRCV
eukprot:COSAG01_NODE_36123_length_521_cov_598.765403_1_plen_100_part_01